MKRPNYNDNECLKKYYFHISRKDSEVPMIIIPTIQDVKYDGDFDFVVMTQSPNYTPKEVDYIIEIFMALIYDELKVSTIMII